MRNRGRQLADELTEGNLHYQAQYKPERGFPLERSGMRNRLRQLSDGLTDFVPPSAGLCRSKSEGNPPFSEVKPEPYHRAELINIEYKRF